MSSAVTATAPKAPEPLSKGKRDLLRFMNTAVLLLSALIVWISIDTFQEVDFSRTAHT